MKKNKPGITTTIKKTDLKEINYDKDEKYAEEKIILKVMKKGFESLTIEELAVTLISPSFEYEYKNKTGQEWTSDYKSKAQERLNFAKFNIQWNTKLNSSNPSNLKTPFSVLFDLVERGDISRVTEYLRKNAQYQDELLYCVDKNKKSILHIAAKFGHTNLTEVLLSRGFSIHMRDKFLRSPLHTACQNGRATVADVLIKSGSDLYARDTIGRTCLHYASCSNSIELITLILGIDPDLVHIKDTYGRSPMHYLVWNSNPNQLEIARLLLNSKAEVDSLDEENMTPLHYASDAGKGRIIPLLLKHGANPFLRDGRTHRTAVELALTDNIREIIIVYSGKPYQVGKSDLEELKVTGEKLDLDGEKQEIKRVRHQKPNAKNVKLSNIQEESYQNNMNINNENMNEFLFKSQKEKLIGYLKNIQEYGVKSMQHITKPSLYSGSWLESVNNIDDLFKLINTYTPTEAILRIFNIISPYQSTFPQLKGEEENMANFFNIKAENLNIVPQTQVTNNYIPPALSQYTDGNINASNNEINILKEEIKNLQMHMQENKNSEFMNLQNKINQYELENSVLKINSERLLESIQTLNEKINNYKSIIEEYKINEISSKDLIQNLTDEIEQLKSELTKLQEKKILGKSGLITVAKNINLPLNYAETKELNLNEEKSVYLFLKIIEEQTPGLDQLLSHYDKDNDLFIYKNEMMNLIEDINLPMDDRAAVLSLAGFDNSNKRIRMPIKNILDNFYKREERKNTKLNIILFKLAYQMHNKQISIERLYEKIIENNKNKNNSNQFMQTLNSFNLIINENEIELLFDFFSSDEGVNIQDFVDKLKLRKKIVDDIGDLDSKIKYGQGKNNVNVSLTTVEAKNREFNIGKNTNLTNLIVSDIIDTVDKEKDKQSENSDNNYDYDKIEESPREVENDTNMQNNKYEQILNSPSNSNSFPTTNSKLIKLNRNLKINGELKIQIKSVESVLIPSIISKPYTLLISCNLKGIDVEFDSKDTITDNTKLVEFNWASRILFKNKSLTDVGSLLKLELKLRTNRGLPIVLGDCMVNWTVTLQPDNLDKFIIADKFQLLSKRMSCIGIISLQAKFIPFGSINSLFNKDGKKNRIPNTLKGLVNVNRNQISNRCEEFYSVRTIEIEIINIQDKQYLYKKNNLIITIEDSDNNEIYKNENFQEIIQNLPFFFNLSPTVKNEKLGLTFFLKDVSGLESVIVGKFSIHFDSNQMNLQTFSNKYILDVIRKNYFKISANKVENYNITFFMKFTFQNILNKKNSETEGKVETDLNNEFPDEGEIIKNNEINNINDDMVENLYDNISKKINDSANNQIEEENF